MGIETIDGLHYITGAPEWLEYTVRAVYFLMAVCLAATCYGIYRGSNPSPGWKMLLGGLGLLAVRAAVVQVFRWETALTIEGPLVGIIGMGLILTSMGRWLSRVRSTGQLPPT